MMSLLTTKIMNEGNQYQSNGMMSLLTTRNVNERDQYQSNGMMSPLTTRNVNEGDQYQSRDDEATVNEEWCGIAESMISIHRLWTA